MSELHTERLSYYRSGLLAGFVLGCVAAGLLVIMAFGARP